MELSYMYVDNCAMQLVRNPSQFDVLLTSNISGSIGMLASASLGATGSGLYEPIHGSAPDIAGQNIANPLATILSVAMMLKYSLGQPEASDMIEKAVADVLNEVRTPDIYVDGFKKVSCTEMGDAVCAKIKAM